ncbi:hypothetical protein Tco_0323164 [Tanacetum coccineum]
MQEVILFYNGLGIPTRQILDSRGAIPSKTIADAKVAFQEMAEYSQKWHNSTFRTRSTETSDGLAAIQAQLNNLGREIRKVNEKFYVAQITLRVGEEKIIFTSVKPASSLIKRVYMLSLRERMELDLEARLMGETLVINRSLDPYFKDYIKLNDLNEAFEIRRNQGDDLMPTIKEGEVIEEFRTKDDELDTEIDDYLRIGDVIFGKPFLKEVRTKTRRFEGMITIYNGDDEVTYQMVRSHLRFKHHTNEQCNKIPPLLKVSDEDKMNGIWHPYQKLKGFYKGVLNLGPDYIRDAKMEEWLIRGHISVHEMKW